MKNTTAAVVPFQFQSNQIRTITVDDSSWFVAKDVCETLDIQWRGSGTLSFLDDDEKGVRNFRTPRGEQGTLIISESGLYTLIIHSNNPQAKPFRRWVTREVLPAIRRTGSYSIAQRTTHLLESEVKVVAQLLGQVIVRENLTDRSRWQLVDLLFHELFGRGVEMLSEPWFSGVEPKEEQQRIDGELVDRFVRECFAHDATGKVLLTAAHQRFVQWHDEVGLGSARQSAKWLATSLQSIGETVMDGDGATWLFNLRLVDEVQA